jgi:predicted PurR-regulated permease PerM
MLNVPLNTATRLGLNVLGLLAMVVALRLGETVFIPTIIALLVAAVLGPGAVWLHKKLKIRWTLACITVITLLVLFNLLITMVFALAITRMLQVVPRTDEDLLKTYNSFRAKLDQISPVPLDEDLFPENPQEVSKIQAFQYLSEAAPKFFQQLAIYGGNWLWQLILILFILLFLLLEGRMLTRRVVEIFGPSEEVKAKVTTVLIEMARQVRTYLVWRTIINFGLAVVVGVVYQLAGLKQAWTWAIMLAILNYVPYLGPLVAGIPPVLDAFLSISALGAVNVLIFFVLIIVLEGYLVVPLLMGRSMDLNATTVMLACLFWDLVWGTVGLFLAMPLMAAIKSICYSVPGWRPWANLMSAAEEEPQPVILAPPAPAPRSEPADGIAKTGVDGALARNGALSLPRSMPLQSIMWILPPLAYILGVLGFLFLLYMVHP